MNILRLTKWVTGVIIAACMLTPVIATAESLPYDDSTYLNHFEAVVQVSDWGWMDGYSDGRFRGYNEMNRAELAKVLALSTGMSDEELETTVNEYVAANGLAASFNDVDAAMSADQLWYVDYVIYGKSQGWFSGYPDGTFRPGDPANLAETIRMIMESQWGTPSDAYAGTYWYDRYFGMLDYFDVIHESGDKFYYTFTGEPVGFNQVPTSKVTRSDVAELLYRIETVLGEREGSFTEYDPYLTLEEYAELYDADVEIRTKTDSLKVSITDGNLGFKAHEIEIEGGTEEDLRVYIEDPSAFNNGYQTLWKLLEKPDLGAYETVLAIRIIDLDYPRPKVSDVDCYIYNGAESDEEAEPTCHGDDDILSGDFEFVSYLNPVDYEEYIDDNNTYRIEYPDDWVSDFSNGFSITTPEDGESFAALSLEVRDVSDYEDLTLEDYAAVLIEELESNGLDYNDLESGERDFGLNEGYYLLGDYSVFGFGVEALRQFTIIDNSAYILTYIYEKDKSLIYDHVATHALDSFELLYETEPSTINYYQIYTDETHKLSIQYPDDWKFQYRPEGALASFTSPLEGEEDLFQENVVLSVEDASEADQTLSVYIETVRAEVADDLPEDAYLPRPPEEGYYYDVLKTGSEKFGPYYAYYTQLSYYTDVDNDPVEWRVYAVVTIQNDQAYILVYTYEAEKETYYDEYIDYMMDSFEMDVSVYLSTSDYEASVMEVVSRIYNRIEDTVDSYNDAVPNIVTTDTEIEIRNMNADYEDALSAFESSDEVYEFKSEEVVQQNIFKKEFGEYLEIAEKYLNNYEQMLNYYSNGEHKKDPSMATEHDDDLNTQFSNLIEQKAEIEDELSAY